MKSDEETVRAADGEHPGHRTHTNEEAGSIVLHVGYDMDEKEQTDIVSGAVCREEEIVMEYKREEANEAAVAKQTLESNDATSKEDVEIGRLIEERRSTSKGEQQRLKDLIKQIQKCIRDKKRATRQEEIQRILEDFKGIMNIPGIKSARRRVLINKIKNEKGEVITSREGMANVLENFSKKLYDDHEHEETEQEHEENETERSIDEQSKDTSEMTKFQRSRLKSYRLQSTVSKKASQQTAPESER